MLSGGRTAQQASRRRNSGSDENNGAAAERSPALISREEARDGIRLERLKWAQNACLQPAERRSDHYNTEIVLVTPRARFFHASGNTRIRQQAVSSSAGAVQLVRPGADRGDARPAQRFA